MSTMQMFYNRLFHGRDDHDPHLARLAQLTKVSAAQVRILKTALSWFDWPTTTE